MNVKYNFQNFYCQWSDFQNPVCQVPDTANLSPTSNLPNPLENQ